MTETAFAFNPFAEGFAEDPYPHYAQLRAAAPAYEHPLGFWIISRYEDVSRLQRSAHSVDEANLTRLPRWKSDSGALGRENRMMRGLAVLDQDPPDHTRLRRLVAAPFTRRGAAALLPRIEAIVEAALDRIAAADRADGADGADVVAELAFPLPFTVISEVLGIPVTGQDRVRELTGTLALGLEPLAQPAVQEAVRAANEELTLIVRELTGWKRRHPGDDLISALIAASDEGALTEDELVAQVMFLYIAGHETTANLIAGGILALLRHHDQYRMLQRDPGLAANAIEELLRYDTPVHLMRRVTTEPLSVGGQLIPAGSWVVAALAAANRDPSYWGATAGELRLDRPNAHLNVSFGAGAHHCLGAGLARLEAQVAITGFARRFPAAELVDVRWNGRINVRGPKSLTITTP
jgi:cytochrome P450